jgi:hypothetical protein
MPAERIRPQRLSYTIIESSEMTGLSRNAIFDLLKIGALQRVRAGKRALIRAADLENFLARGGVSELSNKCRPKRPAVEAQAEGHANP